MLTKRWRTITAVLLLVLSVQTSAPLFTGSVQAARLTSRSLRLSSSEPGEANVRYRFSFGYTTAAAVGSVELELCSNDPFVGTACVAPAGLDAGAATLASQSGETGFSIHPSSTANRLVLTRVPTVVVPQLAVYEFSGVTNPDDGGSYYVRAATFSSTDATGPRIDEGGMAFMINTGFGVSAEVPPHLTFCVGITITGHNCSTASGDFIDFGQLSTASTRSGTSQFTATTNAESGYTVRLHGTTMTSGSNTIKALATPTASQTNTNQFGLNLRDNGQPNVGSNPSGPGSNAIPTTDYNQPNLYTFESGATMFPPPSYLPPIILNN